MNKINLEICYNYNFEIRRELILLNIKIRICKKNIPILELPKREYRKKKFGRVPL